jgi:FMN-dependent NADH-azoreductase
MSHILLITSSPRLESYSTQVASALAEELVARAPLNSTLTTRDLAREPLPHIDDTFAVARNRPADKLTAAQKAALMLSDTLIQELLAADTLIIAAGMINFGIPSSLKAYIDHIVRPGVSFRYTANGAEGLIKGKKVYLVVARGGLFIEGPLQKLFFQVSYLSASLPFLVLTDIVLIVVDGVALGHEMADRAVKDALARVSAIAAYGYAPHSVRFAT